MKILLVGANGQVGRAIEDLCKDKQVECIALSREQLDIADAKAIEATLTQYVSANNYLVNTAAYTAVDKAEDEIEQCYKINRDAVANLAHFSKKHKIPLIHISTDYVFSGDSEHPYSEIDQPDPLSVYGASKLAGERVLQEIWSQHIILRVSWVFGQYGKNFVKTILRLANEQETLRIVADQHGNPTGAGHIAEVILQIIQCLENASGRFVWGTYHYCDSPSTTWFDFARVIVDMARQIKSLKVRDIQAITTAEFPTKAKRPMNSCLNCDKIAEIFDIDQYEWQDELAVLIKKLQN